MKQRYLGNVQILRGVAAVMVLVAHALDQFTNHPIAGMTPLRNLPGIVWGNGVDIFFIVSGFIMLYLANGHFAEAGYPAEFMKRRIIRVVPPYWVITSLMVMAALFASGAVNHGIPSWGYVVASYLFFPMARADGVIHPIMSLGWTLNYEFFFYALFTAALFFPQRKALIGLSAVFIALVLVHPFMPHGALSFWTNPIILNFLVGLGLAQLFIRNVEIPTPVAILFVVLCVVFFVTDPFAPLFGARSVIVPATLLAAAGILGKSVNWPRVALAIGDASYSIYLTHPFTLNILTMVWRKAGLPLSSVLYFLCLMLGSLAVGYVAFLWMEKPLINGLRAWFEPRRETLAA
ncbi:MAG: acyltransferase [Sphingomonas phyllosphaerae]